LMASEKLADASKFLKKIIIFFYSAPDLGLQTGTEQNRVPWPTVARIGRCQPSGTHQAYSRYYCTSMSL
jgi:hypothetical protein